MMDQMPGCEQALGLFSAGKGVNFDRSSLWPTDYEGQLWRLLPSRHCGGREQPVCEREAAMPELVQVRSLLTARFGIFSGLVALSTWHRWLLKIERWIVREIKQHRFNADRLTDGAELDPDADTTSEALKRFVQRFSESVPGWQKPQMWLWVAVKVRLLLVKMFGFRQGRCKLTVPWDGLQCLEMTASLVECKLPIHLHRYPWRISAFK